MYTIDAHGAVRQVGSYSTPGGADEVAIAPAGFGSLAGDALLTVDAGASGGEVVAISPSGTTQTIATFPEGVNPMVPIPKTSTPTSVPAAGLYLSDDTTGYTYMAPAAQLAGYGGDVIVGSELHALFWALEPTSNGITAIPLQTNFPSGTYSLEQAIFVP